MYSTQAVSLTTHTGPDSAMPSIIISHIGHVVMSDCGALLTCELSAVVPVTGPAGDVAAGNQKCEDNCQD